MAVKVAINGYGNIGKRVADAVAKQDDMELVGVAKTRPNFEAFIAVQKGYPLYASEEDKIARGCMRPIEDVLWRVEYSLLLAN
jgi:glyceraldehyde-3-phosphate dehydrogenase (NAD(P))